LTGHYKKNYKISLSEVKPSEKTPPSMPMYYVYVLKINEKFYIGYTEDLRRRFKEHCKKGMVELIYYESYKYKSFATKREKKLKHYGSAWRALKQRILA